MKALIEPPSHLYPLEQAHLFRRDMRIVKMWHDCGEWPAGNLMSMAVLTIAPSFSPEPRSPRAGGAPRFPCLAFLINEVPQICRDQALLMFAISIPEFWMSDSQDFI